MNYTASAANRICFYFGSDLQMVTYGLFSAVLHF